MSIHDTLDVPDDAAAHEGAGSCFTRDRFGKKHKVELKNMKKNIALFLSVFLGSQLGPLGPARADSHKSTNIRVDSAELEPFSAFERKTEPEGKPVFYSDGATTVGFNDDGEPNVGTRF